MASLKSVPMSDKRYDEVSQYVRQSYPQSCILYVDEIINPSLSEAYEWQKEQLIKLRGKDVIKERILFHGTSEACAQSIAVRGYDIDKNKVAAFGLGTYFATTAIYSLGYAKDNQQKECFMLVNKVLVGNMGMYGSHQPIKTDLHDNSGNHPTNPSIIVSPYNNGAVPQYIIAFYKHAK